MSNKKIELKSVVTIAMMLSLAALFSTIAFSIPNSLTLQGKLTNLAGVSQQGTFNFTFAIYDNTTGGSKLWESLNQSITTDANGIYDVILNNVNLSFAEQYYLGIAVQGENESVPRINLTSAPYSFRSNTSEALNPNASYFVTNLSISGHATIGNGTTNLEISTRAFNFSTITGNLIINGTITANNITAVRFTGKLDCGMIDGGSDGNFCADAIVGGAAVTGAGNTGNFSYWTGENTLGNGTLFYSNGLIGIGTISPGRILTINGSPEINGTLFVSSNILIGNNPIQLQKDFNLANISNNTLTKDNNASIALWNISSAFKTIFPRDTTWIVRIGNASNPNLMNDSLIVVGNASIYGILNATTIDGSLIRQNANQVQTINAVFNLLNLTQFFGDSGINGSVLRTSNISAIRETFDLRNISNYTQYIHQKDFNLGNISNNTLTKDNNASIAVWNYTATALITPNAYAINLTWNSKGEFNLTIPTNFSMISINGIGIQINRSSVIIRGATTTNVFH